MRNSEQVRNALQKLLYFFSCAELTQVASIDFSGPAVVSKRNLGCGRLRNFDTHFVDVLGQRGKRKSDFRVNSDICAVGTREKNEFFSRSSMFSRIEGIREQVLFPMREIVIKILAVLFNDKGRLLNSPISVISLIRVADENVVVAEWSVRRERRMPIEFQIIVFLLDVDHIEESSRGYE